MFAEMAGNTCFFVQRVEWRERAREVDRSPDKKCPICFEILIKI